MVSNRDGYPEILTSAQTAQLLQLSVEHVRKLVRQGRVPVRGFPDGRAIRFVRDELLAWMLEQPGYDRSPGV